jgi:hypothetical protein
LRNRFSDLVDVGYSIHFRVEHGANEFARGASHINAIESFWTLPGADSSIVQRTYTRVVDSAAAIPVIASFTL